MIPNPTATEFDPSATEARLWLKCHAEVLDTLRDLFIERAISLDPLLILVSE